MATLPVAIARLIYITFHPLHPRGWCSRPDSLCCSYGSSYFSSIIIFLFNYPLVVFIISLEISCLLVNINAANKFSKYIIHHSKLFSTLKYYRKILLYNSKYFKHLRTLFEACSSVWKPTSFASLSAELFRCCRFLSTYYFWVVV